MRFLIQLISNSADLISGLFRSIPDVGILLLKLWTCKKLWSFKENDGAIPGRNTRGSGPVVHFFIFSRAFADFGCRPDH